MKSLLMFTLSALFSLSLFAQKASNPDYEAAKQDITKTLGFVPTFMAVFPEAGLPGAWAEWKGIEIGETKIPGKYKELIGLAVASQIPCVYCIYAHEKFAGLNGATKTELREAVGLAALLRHWSAIAQGWYSDLDSFKRDIDTAFANAAKKGDTKAQPAAAMPSSLTATQQEIWQTFGMIPGMFQAMPESGLEGAWKALKAVEMGETAIPGKYKELLLVGVASSVPCNFCVYFHKKRAEAAGATQEEISEAVAMAALTRQWSTVLNGNHLSLPQFQQEVDKIVANAKKSMKKAPAKK